MSIRRPQSRAIVAIAAALLFALQMVLNASATAALIQRDLFGNVICIGDSVDGNNHDTGHLPDCCKLSCSSCVPFHIGSPPQSVKIVLPLHEWTSDQLVAAATPLTRTKHNPAHPRAPPLAV